jgi:hypothetical protein
MSSMIAYRMFGAPSGAAGGMGNAGSESSNVRPIRPGKPLALAVRLHPSPFVRRVVTAPPWARAGWRHITRRG